MTGRRWLLTILLAAANAALALAAWSRRPWANGPAEWRWDYISAGGLEPNAAAWLVILAALAGLGVLWGHRRLAAWRGAPLAAVACGAAFTFALVAVQPGGFARVTGALVSRNSFGYVWDAALAPSSSALLADYPAASAGLNQHSLTHPPGALLAVRALGWLDRVLPPPAPARPRAAGAGGGEDTASVIGATAAPEAAPTSAGERGGRGLPSLAAAAIEREVARARSHGRPVPQPPPGPWAVAALAVLLPGLSALAAWPLYLLARRFGQARETALLAAVTWLLVPARSLFTPSFDQALPVLLVGAAWLAASGGRTRAAAAGVLLFAACFASYGCLPALPLVAVCAAAAPAAAGRRDRLRWGALALGFGVPYLALAVAAGHDPWHALRAALALHQQIAVAPRSYATWLVWNPYDFALLLSPWVLGFAAAALLPGAWQHESEGSPGAAAARPATGLLAAWTWWGLLAMLLLSGGVRGEAGRIWVLWMPFACLFAAAAAASGGGLRRAGGLARPEPREAAPRAGAWKTGVALLLATEAALTLALAASMVFVSSS
ncbi:MAG TPA: hypothetical protein VE075_01310 [Thermoanaerobaculia bacterium]|nr:hypothetical protein [Thermoanaerobaculia bacterium]